MEPRHAPGKTTALRALAREWQSWCRTHYVVDPEPRGISSSSGLILLTTNERVDRLDPALVRPGRCLAPIEFTRSETLADLLERRGTSPQITNGVTQTEEYGSDL